MFVFPTFIILAVYNNLQLRQSWEKQERQLLKLEVKQNCLVQSVIPQCSADNNGLPFCPPLRECSRKPNVALVKDSPNISPPTKKKEDEK